MKLTFFLAFLTLAAAHNWVASMSRVPRAATTFPCMAKRSALPHVQLGLTQRFTVEWAMGHNSFNYFTLLRAEDSDLMVRHTQSLLEDYINDAPAGSNYINDITWKAYRRTNTETGCHRDENDNVIPANGGLYANTNPIQPTDPRYIPRPAEFNQGPLNRIRNNNGQGYQWAYTAAQRPDDAVVVYTNPNYPWILGVWKYEITQDCAGEVDVARFWIPDARPGDYILHYKWRGYYDCIDINVLDQAADVQYPYGYTDPNVDTYTSRRVDHCFYPENPVIGATQYAFLGIPMEVFGANGQKVCFDHCVRRWAEGCWGFNVFNYGLGRRQFGPHWDNQNNFIEDFVNKAIFDTDDRFTEDQFDGMTARTSLRDRLDQRLASGDDPLMCWPLFPRAPTTTEDKYIITDDPRDPIWYSTCYEIIRVIEFIGYSIGNGTGENSAPRGDWRFLGDCISCEDRERAAQNRVPEWNLAAECRNCDREPAVNVEPAFPDILMGAGYCTHPDGSGTCEKDIRTDIYDLFDSNGNRVLNSGTSAPNYEACGAYAAADPECGNYWSYGITSDRTRTDWCRCIRASCSDVCGVRWNDRRWAFTKKTETEFGGSPDPNCDRGVISTGDQNAGGVCCSEGCNQCNSNSVTNGGATGGVCYPQSVPTYRRCDTHGPPCHLASSSFIANPPFIQTPGV